MRSISDRSRSVRLWHLFWLACLALVLNGCGGESSSSAAASANSADVTGALPVILDTPVTAAVAGGYYSYTPSYLYGLPEAVSFTIRNKPEWAFFRPKTGQLFGSPRIPHVGAHEDVIITIVTPDGSLPVGPFTVVVDEPAEVTLAEESPAPEPAAPVPATPPPVKPPAQSPPPATTPANPAPPQQSAQKPAAKPVTQPEQKRKLVREQNPGHYIAVNRWDTRRNMLDALRPGVRGLQKRYYWAELEPRWGQYDFEQLEADLDLLESQGKRLVVFVEDKSFNNDIPTPGYLSSLTARNRKGGYTAIRWKPYVVERFKLLIDEIGRRYDGHPAFEGIAIQESEPGFNDAVRRQYGYRPEIYRDAVIDVLTSAAQSIPTSTVFWYMNFFPENRDYIVAIANKVGPQGVAVGGPDVLPDNAPLARLTYPYYDQLEGKMVLFNSMQYNSFRHVRKRNSGGGRYWNMWQLYNFARDELHVTYLFWNRPPYADPPGSYDWKAALPVIKANPVIRPSWVDKLAKN